LISQVGNAALEIGELLAAYDLGISRFALLGNQADRGPRRHSRRADLAREELSVERMAPVQDGLELIVGTAWDARFVPIVLVGLGGVRAAIFGDVAVALRPVEADGARRLVLSLRGAALFTGARGRPRVDLAAAAEEAAALSWLGATYRDVDELEINPFLVTRPGAVALDARVIPRDA
jgi:acetate---CoA ligase (ADP-forming)